MSEYHGRLNAFEANAFQNSFLQNAERVVGYIDELVVIARTLEARADAADDLVDALQHFIANYDDFAHHPEFQMVLASLTAYVIKRGKDD